jgi:NADPH2:quinone reductase
MRWLPERSAATGTLPATRIGGAVINSGRLAGPGSTINLGQLWIRRLRPLGTTFSDRRLEELADACASSRPASLPPSRRRIGPVVNLVVGVEDATQAADYMRRQQAVSKIVVHMP